MVSLFFSMPEKRHSRPTAPGRGEPPNKARLTAKTCQAAQGRSRFAAQAYIVTGLARAIAGDFDEIAIGITEVHRFHLPLGASLFDWSNFYLDALHGKIANNVLYFSGTDQTDVTSPGRRDIGVWKVLAAERVQIDLLVSEVERVEFTFKDDMLHSEHTLIELDGSRKVAHSEYDVVNAGNFHLGTPMRTFDRVPFRLRIARSSTGSGQV